MNDRWMGKQTIHRPHKGHQCFKVNGAMIKRQAQGHHLTNSNLLDTVLIGINTGFFLQSPDCYRKNLRWNNLQQCGCAVLLPVNAADVGYRNAPLLQIRLCQSIARRYFAVGFFAFPESVFTRCFPTLEPNRRRSTRTMCSRLRWSIVSAKATSYIASLKSVFSSCGQYPQYRSQAHRAILSRHLADSPSSSRRWAGTMERKYRYAPNRYAAAYRPLAVIDMGVEGRRGLQAFRNGFQHDRIHRNLMIPACITAEQPVFLHKIRHVRFIHIGDVWNGFQDSEVIWETIFLCMPK